MSDAHLWVKIRAKPGHGEVSWLHGMVAPQPDSIPRTALLRNGNPMISRLPFVLVAAALGTALQAGDRKRR